MKNDVLLAGLCCLLVPAVITDLRWRRIPNRLALAGVLGGLLLALGLGGLPALGSALAALLTAFGLTFPLWLCGWLGGGDIKLLAAVATFTGLALVPHLLAFTAFCGLLLAVGTLLRRRLPSAAPSPAGLPNATPLPATAGPPRLPYAVAIAGGALLAMLQANTGLPA